jgi:hypothetical protein
MALQPFVDLGSFFSFLIYIQSVRLLGRGISPSQGYFLYTEQHIHRINAHRHPCLEWDSDHDPSVLVGEGGSCLTRSGHCDGRLHQILDTMYILIEDSAIQLTAAKTKRKRMHLVECTKRNVSLLQRHRSTHVHFFFFLPFFV